MFRREEAERRELINQMKESASKLGLTSIVDILVNYEGKYNDLKLFFYIILLRIYFFNNSTGTLGKMRRNVHGTNDIVRSNHDKLIYNECNMKTLMGMMREIKEDLLKFTFHMRMDYCDVGNFFPLKSDQDLQNFLDRSNPDWLLRMKGFNHLLYTTVTNNKRRFGVALLHTLFTRSYISSHGWPLPG